MPRQPSSLASDRLLSLVASGGGRGASADLVERLEGGWVPVEPGSIELPRRVGDGEGGGEGGDVVPGHPGDPGHPVAGWDPGTGRGAGSGRRSRGAHEPGRHRDPLRRQGPAVVTLPVSLRGARLDVSWLGIVALVIVLALAALVFAVRVARAEGGVEPQPVAGSTPLGLVRSATPSGFGSSPATGGATGAAAVGVAGPGGPGKGAVATGPASASSTTIVVHVVGQVAHPGVVTLPAGSRIGEAVTRAGGPLPGADVARLNLAQFLADGEQVYVPRPGEDPPAPIGGAGGAGGPGGGADGGPAGSSTVAAVVDLNSADLAGLDTLPGVGPVLAQRIVDWRVQHGRFSAIDELGEVSGIGDKLLEQLRPLVRV